MDPGDEARDRCFFLPRLGQATTSLDPLIDKTRTAKCARCRFCHPLHTRESSNLLFLYWPRFVLMPKE